MTQMQGWRWPGPGEPEHLTFADVGLPAPAAGEVLVANRVVAVNPVDWKLVASGHPDWRPGQVPGVDGMGVVAEVGPGVTHLRVGTRVAYHGDLRRHGSYARHTLVPARAVIPVPDALSDEAAAAFPCPGLTAWQALGKIPDVAGEALLVAGAAGSVGRYVVALGLARGARVFAVAGRRHHDELRRLGVPGVADYRDADWAEQLRAANGGEPFHAVVDLVSSEQAGRLAEHLGYYGHLVAVLGRVDHNPVPPFTRCISLHEIALGALHAHGSDRQWHRLVHAGQEMLAGMVTGELPTAPLEMRPFADLPAALGEAMRSGQGRKFLLRV